MMRIYCERRTRQLNPVPKTKDNPFGQQRRKITTLDQYEKNHVTRLLKKLRNGSALNKMDRKFADECICDAVGSVSKGVLGQENAPL